MIFVPNEYDLAEVQLGNQVTYQKIKTIFTALHISFLDDMTHIHKFTR